MMQCKIRWRSQERNEEKENGFLAMLSVPRRGTCSDQRFFGRNRKTFPWTWYMGMASSRCPSSCRGRTHIVLRNTGLLERRGEALVRLSQTPLLGYADGAIGYRWLALALDPCARHAPINGLHRCNCGVTCRQQLSCDEAQQHRFG